ncbi:unnamed protein product [Tuber melanosporum]|uniref:(Perigord truffle) hypothetical protein n=1 Tax=Tuber melanosporum (strain Mel28) TaxID=656061 RepID=D5GN91_TUBMM|nr:uncharacterized protein GSTUM_00011162001 [Tuber melanosporum]CAZ85984.1 unnamed protein product [Tuber melanosporum]
MTEFTPKQVYPNQCVCPTGDQFIDWVRQEVNSFGGGSTYLDLDLFGVAEDILSGSAVERNIVAFNAVISWRVKVQEEIMALANELVEREIIPESAVHSPIQLLPISQEAYQNRMTLVKLVPELLERFEIPESKDELQIKFNAPLYWFAIVLSRARREAPFKCELKKVMGALVDLGIAKVPEGWEKDEWISKMTVDTELKEETLYLGEDEITKRLTKLKPYLGWRLPPYNVFKAAENTKAEADSEAVVVVTKDLDGGEEPADLAVGFADIEDVSEGAGGGAGEGAGEGAGGGTGTRGILRDIVLVITLSVLYIMLSGVEMPLAFRQGIERMAGRVRYWTDSIGEEILMLASSPE